MLHPRGETLPGNPQPSMPEMQTWLLLANKRRQAPSLVRQYLVADQQSVTIDRHCAIGQSGILPNGELIVSLLQQPANRDL